MNYTVENGLPYADGKLVTLAASHDVSEQAELWYLGKLFPGVYWKAEIVGEDIVMWCPQSQSMGTTREDFQELIDYHINVQLLGGDFKQVISLSEEVTVQCQSYTQVMLFFEEEVDVQYWELHPMDE
jgi:hypothetical protein